MEILGIGPSELLFIVVIALIVLGPRDMQKAGRMIGRWLRKVVTSDGWKLFQQTSREIQTLPNRLMREAALDEMKELQKDLRQPLTTDGRVTASGTTPNQPNLQGPPPPAPAANDNSKLPTEPPDGPTPSKEEPGE